MRDIKEIQKHIEECEQAVKDDSAYYRDQSSADTEGMLGGFQAGLKMVQAGKTSEEITAYAQRAQHNYVSRGHDLEDAWESGYLCALFWVGEQYDWDEEGVPIFREGNIFGEPVGK